VNVYLLNATINGKLLAEILTSRIKVSGIIGLNKDGIKKTSEYYDYTEFCALNGIPYFQMKSYSLTDKDDRAILESLDIHLIIVASWQRLVPAWLINKCSIGIIGAHGSHEGIERGRGRSPQNWALMMGKTKFIFSIFWIEEEADNGAIIETREFEYLPTDTILVSYVKLNLMKADMIITNIKNGKIESKAGFIQNKESFYLPQRKKEDGMIDWNRDATDIYNMVRALTKPYPGAFTMNGNIEFIVWAAVPVVMNEVSLYDKLKNGTVISLLNESALIKCGKNLLLINSCSNYEKITAGMVFESADYKKQMRNIIKRHEEKNGTPLSRLVLDEIKE